MDGDKEGRNLFDGLCCMKGTKCFTFTSTQVWASKWNERAYISCKKTKVDHDAICMAVLIQQVVCGEYAFVIHTNNPVSGDSSEIYTEVKKLLQFLRFRVIESNY